MQKKYERIWSEWVKKYDCYSVDFAMKFAIYEYLF